MTSTNQVSPDLKPQHMELIDDYRPSMPDGAYRLVTQQSVQLDGGEEHHYYRDEAFVVSGPRYFLAPDEIQARFPAVGGSGDFGRNLPHVVLRKRALPWERTVWNDSGARTPWLALIVLTDEEFDAAGGEGAISSVNAGELDFVTEAGPPPTFERQPPEGDFLLLPILGDEGDAGDERVHMQVLDLPIDTFSKVCPRRRDLALSAHLRCVDVQDKATQKMVHEGEFPVLVANRFPQQGANHVFLVSLEGYGSLLDGEVPGEGTRVLSPAAASRRSQGSGLRVRLVLMERWSFVNDAKGVHTFGERLQELDAGSFGIAEAASESSYVDDALRLGYVPVPYSPGGVSTGAETVAWYRGPFSPVPSRKVGPGVGTIATADEALVVDEGTGLVDVSYAAAWQLGRLLALANPQVSGALRGFLDDSLDAFAIAQELETFYETHRSAIGRAWEEGEDDSADPAATKVDLADELVDWIGRLMLLEQVPFHYLVADERLLPGESLRLFHLDDTWLEALLEGALSSAIHLSGDDVHRGTMRSELVTAASKVVSQYRNKQTGGAVEPAASPRSDYLTRDKTGFLLRSDLLEAWPGTEIRAFDVHDEALDVLRSERLAAGVLLVIVDGTIDRVELTEPSEGIRFGIDDEESVMLRNLANPTQTEATQTDDLGQKIVIGLSTESASVQTGVLHYTAPMEGAGEGASEQKLYGVLPDVEEPRERPGMSRVGAAAGVLDADGLASALYEALVHWNVFTGSRSSFGPAAYAFQLLLAAEKQTVRWSS